MLTLRDPSLLLKSLTRAFIMGMANAVYPANIYAPEVETTRTEPLPQLLVSQEKFKSEIVDLALRPMPAADFPLKEDDPYIQLQRWEDEFELDKLEL